MHDDAILDRALGSFVGLAVGDAIGTTVEFRPRGSFPPITDMIGGGPFRLEPGQWTDDTSMALCLAESLLAAPTLDHHDLMQRFHRWMMLGENSSTGKCFDIGKTTLRAIGEFGRSGNPTPKLRGRNLAGNGSIMRLAPVAVRWWHNPQMAEQVARRQSETTHNVTEAIDGCALLSRILCGAIAGDGAAALVQDDEAWEGSIRAIGTGSWRGLEEASVESTGYVVNTLQAALWSFTQGDDFESVILRAVNLGGDADTIAAVAGQIAGATWGLSAIPPRWTQRIYSGERILKLAMDLFMAGRTNAFSQESVKDWYV